MISLTQHTSNILILVFRPLFNYLGPHICYRPIKIMKIHIILYIIILKRFDALVKYSINKNNTIPKKIFSLYICFILRLN